MITLNLHGKLGSEVGIESISLNARTVQEAIHAIEIQTKAFIPAVKSLMDKFDTAFEMLIDGKLHSYDQDVIRVLPEGDHEVDIFPVIQAGKSKWTQIIVGVVLIAAAAVINFYTGGAGSGIFGNISGALSGSAEGFAGFAAQATAMVGFSLVLGGISNMLIKPPSATTAEGQSEESYLFSGSFNRMSQGGPIPVLLGGPLRIGSQVINGFAQVTQVAAVSASDNLVIDGEATYATWDEYLTIKSTRTVEELDQLTWNYEGNDFDEAPHISEGYDG